MGENEKEFKYLSSVVSVECMIAIKSFYGGSAMWRGWRGIGSPRESM